MGVLRTYLALCVIAGHSSHFVFPWPAHGGIQAVQIFFVISGFYMALVSPKYASALEFYVSRLLRILVPYWAVLATVTLGWTLTGVLLGNWGRLAPYVNYAPEQNGFAGVAFTTLANLVLFFQDWVLFLSHGVGEGLRFTLDYRNNDFPLFRFLVIPQAWSVGVELTFYLFVPLIARLSNRALWALVGLSLACRVVGYEVFGLNHDPWTYRFFPFELATFGLGMLSCRYYLRWKPLLARRIPSHAKISPLRYVGLVVTFLGFFLVAKVTTAVAAKFISADYAELLSHFGWAVAIPFLFHVCERVRWDRYIGDLSYPIYLVHFFTIWVVRAVIAYAHVPAALLGEISALASIGFAVFLVALVVGPLDKVRYALAKGMAAKAVRPQLQSND